MRAAATTSEETRGTFRHTENWKGLTPLLRRRALPLYICAGRGLRFAGLRPGARRNSRRIRWPERSYSTAPRTSGPALHGGSESSHRFAGNYDTGRRFPPPRAKRTAAFHRREQDLGAALAPADAPSDPDKIQGRGFPGRALSA